MLGRKTMVRVALAAILLTLALPALPAYGAPSHGDDGGSAVAAAWSWIGGAWSALSQQLAQGMSALFAADTTAAPPVDTTLAPVPDAEGLTGELPDPGSDLLPIADPNG